MSLKGFWLVSVWKVYMFVFCSLFATGKKEYVMLR